MRALVVSAFALTLFVSAVTVYVALGSGSMVGEPHIVIAIEPPPKTLAATIARKIKPVEPVATEPTGATTTAANQTVDTSETVSLPVANNTAETASGPKLTPTTSPENSDTDAAESDARTATTSRRTTEVARPVATTPSATVDPFFSAAEPGLGLGVGNLGPLEPISEN